MPPYMPTQPVPQLPTLTGANNAYRILAQHYALPRPFAPGQSSMPPRPGIPPTTRPGSTGGTPTYASNQPSYAPAQGGGQAAPPYNPQYTQPKWAQEGYNYYLVPGQTGAHINAMDWSSWKQRTQPYGGIDPGPMSFASPDPGHPEIGPRMDYWWNNMFNPNDRAYLATWDKMPGGAQYRSALLYYYATGQNDRADQIKNQYENAHRVYSQNQNAAPPPQGIGYLQNPYIPGLA